MSLLENEIKKAIEKAMLVNNEVTEEEKLNIARSVEREHLIAKIENLNAKIERLTAERERQISEIKRQTAERERQIAEREHLNTEIEHLIPRKNMENNDTMRIGVYSPEMIFLFIKQFIGSKYKLIMYDLFTT